MLWLLRHGADLNFRRCAVRWHEAAKNAPPIVAIIILNWNGLRDTLECLESLAMITYPNYELIVVDNSSTD